MTSRQYWVSGMSRLGVALLAASGCNSSTINVGSNPEGQKTGPTSCYSATLPEWVQSTGIETLIDAQPGTWELIQADYRVESIPAVSGGATNSFHLRSKGAGAAEIVCSNLSAGASAPVTFKLKFPSLLSRADGKIAERLDSTYTISVTDTDGDSVALSAVEAADPQEDNDVASLLQKTEAQGAKIGVYRMNPGSVWLRITGENKHEGARFKADALLRFQLK